MFIINLFEYYFYKSMINIFQPDPLAIPDTKVYLFSLMIQNLQLEEETLQHIRYMEDEV